eukprot:scaffold5247_cov45-Cyclotella_meneghiniana.AAC.2
MLRLLPARERGAVSSLVAAVGVLRGEAKVAAVIVSDVSSKTLFTNANVTLVSCSVASML